MMQSWNAHCFIYIWAFLTTCHISQSHPLSVSSSFPASGLTWPRAPGLCYVQPDVIPGSLVLQVNLDRCKMQKEMQKMERAPLGSLQLLHRLEPMTKNRLLVSPCFVLGGFFVLFFAHQIWRLYISACEGRQDKEQTLWCIADREVGLSVPLHSSFSSLLV